MKVCDTIQMLESEKSRKLMTALYGEAAVDANIERYQNLVKSFQKKFAEEDVTLFSSPVRKSAAIIRIITMEKSLQEALT